MTCSKVENPVRFARSSIMSNASYTMVVATLLLPHRKTVDKVLDMFAIKADIARDFMFFGFLRRDIPLLPGGLFFRTLEPYLERPCFRLLTPPVSSEPRTM